MRLIEAIQNVGGFTDSYNNNHHVSNNQSDSNQSTFTTGAQKIFKPKKIKNERKRELSPKSSSSDLEHFYFSENSINPSSASVALM